MWKLIYSYTLSGKPRREQRSVERSISHIIYNAKHGFDKVVTGFTFHFATGLGKILRSGGDLVHEVEKFVSWSLKDIDRRLNQPKTDFLER